MGGERPADEATAPATTLRRRLANLEALVNRSPSVIFLWRIADGWPVEYVSRNVRQFGYEPEDFISGRVSWPGITHPEDVARLECEVAEHMSTGRTAFDQHYRLTTRTGVVRWVQDHTIAVHDANGTLTHFQGIITDITDRRQTEEALRQSEASYRVLAANLADMTFVLNASGILTYVSPQVSQYGFDPADMLGAPFTRFVMDTDCGRAKHALATALTDGTEFLDELRCLDGRGATHWFEFHGSIQRNDLGRMQTLTCIARDVTLRRETEEALRQSRHSLIEYQAQLRSLAEQLSLAEERERRRMAGTLHDGIGQTLALCKMKFDEIRQAHAPAGASGFDDVQNLLENVIQCTRSLIFDLSPPVLYELGLGAAIEWLAERITEQHGLDVSLSGTRRKYDLVDGNRAILFQAVREALMNVVKHAQATRVAITLQQPDGHLTIAVEDDGVGFNPAEVLAGTCETGGFGLFNTRERLSLAGGHLHITSSVGHGTRILLSLPCPAP